MVKTKGLLNTLTLYHREGNIIKEEHKQELFETKEVARHEMFDRYYKRTGVELKDSNLNKVQIENIFNATLSMLWVEEVDVKFKERNEKWELEI